eukprot:1869298-Rhodomonas_salina.7
MDAPTSTTAKWCRIAAFTTPSRTSPEATALMYLYPRPSTLNPEPSTGRPKTLGPRPKALRIRHKP